jgi:MerR family transcriptional regulator, copper efflux regulator
MLINELAKATGFSKDTIRYYEKIGLITIPEKARRANNYKEYPDEILRKLRTIAHLKELGFTLEEIRELLVRREMNALDKHTTFRIIEQKMLHLDTQIDRLRLYRLRLEQARMQIQDDTTSHILPLTEMKLAA